jgi:DNA polymerase III subunit alpha, Gram-positive type
MEEQLFKFLQLIKFDDKNNNFVNADIKKVLYLKKTDQLIVFINLVNSLPLDIALDFEEKIKNQNYNFNFIFELNKINDTSIYLKYLDDYINYFFQIKKLNEHSLNILKNNIFPVKEEEIQIIIKKEDYQEVNYWLKDLKRYLFKFGFNFNFSLIFQKSDLILEEKKIEFNNLNNDNRYSIEYKEVKINEIKEYIFLIKESQNKIWEINSFLNNFDNEESNKQLSDDLKLFFKEKEELIKISKEIEIIIQKINFDLHQNYLKKIEDLFKKAFKITSEIKKTIEEKNDFNLDLFKQEKKSENLIIEAEKNLDKKIKNEKIKVFFKVKILNLEKKLTKTGNIYYRLKFNDNTAALSGIYWINDKDLKKKEAKDLLFKNLNLDEEVDIKGSIKIDNYWTKGEPVIEPRIINQSKKNFNQKKIQSKRKNERVELHLHTKMSAMDGSSYIDQYIKQASIWGHKALAITDYSSLQAFPMAYKMEKKYPDFKIIYGLEANLINDQAFFLFNWNKINQDIFYNKKWKEITFLVFDVETTGLYANFYEIIEFGYVLIKNGKQVENEKILIKPEIEIDEASYSSKVNLITNKELENAESWKDAFSKIENLIEGKVLIAHNAEFDFNFLKNGFKKQNKSFNNVVIDTLSLARLLLPDIRSHNLENLAKNFKVKMNKNNKNQEKDLTNKDNTQVAHRADYDSLILSKIWFKMQEVLEIDFNSFNLFDLGNLYQEKTKNIFKKTFGYHFNLLLKKKSGIKNLFKLVSKMHTDFLFGGPKVLKSYLEKYRDDFLVGSGCYNSEIFYCAMNKDEDDLKETIDFYDYIEVQPLSVYKHLFKTKQVTEEQIKLVIKKIIDVSKKSNKLVVATGDCHYLEKAEANKYSLDKLARIVLVNNKIVGGKYHPLAKRNKSALEEIKLDDYPDQHFRSTEEMINDFHFLKDNDLINEIVVENTNKISDQIEKISPFSDKLFLPLLDDAEKNLTEICYKNLYNVYGKEIHPLISERLKIEFELLKKNNFFDLYWICYQLVEQANKDGYIVGSRGTVGSSLVAWLCKISEINPLTPHYYCKKCYQVIFSDDSEIKSGFDLKIKNCSHCSEEFKMDGHNIPYITFFGLNFNKIPDIDLNFPSEYQSKAHNYIKEWFGEKNVYRIGTISTVAQRTAYTFVKNFSEQFKDEEIIKKLNKIDEDLLVDKCTGVKRTSGQHPSGLLILPKNYSIYQFTPINYPADDISSNFKTTHFDYDLLHKNLMKLDILGHVDPTVLKRLQELTKINPKDISCSDEKVINVFSDLSVLNLKKIYLGNYELKFKKEEDMDLSNFDFKLTKIYNESEEIIINEMMKDQVEFGQNELKKKDKRWWDGFKKDHSLLDRKISLYKKIEKLFDDYPNGTFEKIKFYEKTGAIGLPEFGTTFVRQMLKKLEPKTFAELVQISGLSHGKNVWKNNAEDLIFDPGKIEKGKNWELKDVIACRDNIMLDLIKKGLKENDAFIIMENIRKGKSLNLEQKQLLLKHNVDQEYISSCEKIIYLFPKAHATAYVLMAWRIAWFKVYYPAAYYATYFSVRCQVFDIKTMIKGIDEIVNKIEKLKFLEKKKTINNKDKELITIFEVALEMFHREISFSNIDLNKSELDNFLILDDQKKLLPPLTSLDTVGAAIAQSIINSRKEQGPFKSKSDLIERTNISKANLKILEDLGVLDNFEY